MSHFRRTTPLDRLLAGAGRALATLADAVPATQPSPPDGPADPAQRRRSAALMRVNHVGEICAQALYDGQAATARDPELAARFRKAAREEGDHLAWTRERLRELDSRPSLLNPLWYTGALLMGALAGRAGDRLSLGFMAETERQVERHQARHAEMAQALGGAELPPPVPQLMRAAAKVMTTTAHYI